MPSRPRSPRWLLHGVAWAVGIGAFVVVLTPPEECPEVDVAAVDGAIEGAARWAATNQDATGRFTYGYDRDRDQVSQAYNLVRHAGMVNSLFQVAAAGDDRFADAAERGLDFMLDRLVTTTDGASAFAEQGDSAKIGATGLLVASLHHRRLVTGGDAHDDLMRAAGRFLRGQIEEGGSILAFWDPRTGLPVPDLYSAFGTGEAFWALALLDESFPGEGWGADARRIGRYVAVDRRQHEDLWLRIPDHWAAYGFSALGTGLAEPEITYLRRLAGDFGLMTRFESSRQADTPGGWLRGPDALGAGVGALGEGLGSLWRLAQVEPRLADLADDLQERSDCVAGLLTARQVSADAAATMPSPDLAAGAWFHGGYTQVDDQQHAISALLVAREVLAP